MTQPSEVIDLHAHWGTQRGYPLRTAEELALQERNWKQPVHYASEEEMADALRKFRVRAMLDFGYTRYLGIAEARELHEYAFAFERSHPDVVHGFWITLDPRHGQAALDEIQRCRDRFPGPIGVVAAAAPLHLAPSDPVFFPLYEQCIALGAPVLVTVGYTGIGAGQAGGLGVQLEHGHPMHVDRIAARYPDLRIVAGRPAWPWQSEMIAVLRHKANVWNELHGGLPRNFAPELKAEIARTGGDRILFGGDYPLFRYPTLLSDWHALDLPPEVMDKIFSKNARALFENGAAS